VSYNSFILFASTTFSFILQFLTSYLFHICFLSPPKLNLPKMQSQSCSMSLFLLIALSLSTPAPSSAFQRVLVLEGNHPLPPLSSPFLPSFSAPRYTQSSSTLIPPSSSLPSLPLPPFSLSYSSVATASYAVATELRVATQKRAWSPLYAPPCTDLYAQLCDALVLVFPSSAVDVEFALAHLSSRCRREEDEIEEK